MKNCGTAKYLESSDHTKLGLQKFRTRPEVVYNVPYVGLLIDTSHVLAISAQSLPFGESDLWLRRKIGRLYGHGSVILFLAQR